MMKSLIKVFSVLIGNIGFPYNYLFRERVRRIYYNKLGLGKKCQCGQNLLGGTHCWNPSHEQEIRNNKLNDIGI